MARLEATTGLAESRCLQRVRSCPPWASFAAIQLALALAASGCIVEDRHTPHDYYSNSYAPTPTAGCPTVLPLAQATILTGQQLSTPAGAGAGAMIEYLGGGAWHVFTTCDTSYSNYTCSFDVTARAAGGAPIQNITVEGDDAAFSIDPSTADLQATTALDVDGMSFQTTPGTAVNFTVLLDGCLAAENILFADVDPNAPQNVVVFNAPSDPVDLIPSTP